MRLAAAEQAERKGQKSQMNAMAFRARIRFSRKARNEKEPVRRRVFRNGLTSCRFWECMVVQLTGG